LQIAPIRQVQRRSQPGDQVALDHADTVVDGSKPTDKVAVHPSCKPLLAIAREAIVRNAAGSQASTSPDCAQLQLRVQNGTEGSAW
jgi:hypothetical protein